MLLHRRFGKSWQTGKRGGKLDLGEEAKLGVRGDVDVGVTRGCFEVGTSQFAVYNLASDAEGFFRWQHLPMMLEEPDETPLQMVEPHGVRLSVFVWNRGLAHRIGVLG